MILELDGVTCSYGARRVVHGVSLAVGAAGWLGVIGPNGAGKSTLLRAIAALMPAEGTISLDGVALPTTRRGVAQLVAYVPQRPELPAQMTVADYVLLGRTPHLSYLRAESRRDLAAVAAVLERLSLTELRACHLGEISGGEAQRAVLARALAQEAPLLLLDEPTTGLDLRHQHLVLELVDELRHERGLTVVASMHDLALAGQFCDELALLIDGEVVLSGSPDIVLTEENVARHYGARVRRLEGAGDRAVVVGVRAERPERPAGTQRSECPEPAPLVPSRGRASRPDD